MELDKEMLIVKSPLFSWESAIVIIVALFISFYGAFSAQGQVVSSDEYEDCPTGSADSWLDIGNVKAQLFNSGALFWNGEGDAFYEVPKGSNRHSMFNQNLWMSGIVEDEIRVSASSYGPSQLWPGPTLPLDGVLSDCSAYDKIYEMRFADDLVNAEKGGNISTRIRYWPGNIGAPYIEVNGVDGYQPELGDRPGMRGDQALWWIMNDKSGQRSSPLSKPLGVEVRVMAYAFGVPGVIGNTTFYQYEVVNKNETDISDFWIGFFNNPDIGNPEDDWVGTDSSLGMVYSLNGRNTDPDQNIDRLGYGAAPPAIGITIIHASHKADTTFPRATPYVEPGFNFSMRWCNCGDNGISSSSKEIVYNQLRSRYAVGDRQIAYDHQNNTYAFSEYYLPGNLLNNEFWSATNIDGKGQVDSPTDQHILSSFGPVNIKPGETFSITVAIVWSRGDSNLDSFSQLKKDVRFVRERRDHIMKLRTRTPLISPPSYDLQINLFPNPTSGSVNFSVSIPEQSTLILRVVDSLGRLVASRKEMLINAGNTTLPIDVEGWSPGIYHIQYSINGHYGARSFSVMK
jgi:hypothetical protein